jgi:predicted transcriptional regulator
VNKLKITKLLCVAAFLGGCGSLAENHEANSVSAQQSAQSQREAAAFSEKGFSELAQFCAQYIDTGKIGSQPSRAGFERIERSKGIEFELVDRPLITGFGSISALVGPNKGSNQCRVRHMMNVRDINPRMAQAIYNELIKRGWQKVETGSRSSLLTLGKGSQRAEIVAFVQTISSNSNSIVRVKRVSPGS